MNDNGFRQRMLDKTDEELLAIVLNDRRSYQQGALQDAENILKERGIPFVQPEGAIETSSAAIVHYNYWPAVVGVAMVLLSFAGHFFEADAESALAVNLFITVLLRIIVVAWINELCAKYNLKKALWITLGVIFGGWSLIAINFAMAQNQTPVDPDVTLFNESYDHDQHSADDNS